MKQFIKIIFGSCLGVILASFAMIFILFLIGGALARTGQSYTVKENSVLKIDLNYPIPERTNNVQNTSYNLEQDDVLGLHAIVKLINKAKEESNIKGIILDPSQSTLGISSSKELMEALRDFKESGKFVAAYGDFISQGGYYLSSVADYILLNPIGSLDFRGFASFTPFFKDLMDRTSMKMQIYYAGDFKSATEPFRRTNMSEANRLQTRAYISDVYGQFLNEIAENRDMPIDKLQRIADAFLSRNSDDALNLGLVDAVGYEDELYAWIKEKMELDADAKIPIVDLTDYAKTGGINSIGSGKDRIAVVYAEGSIISGENQFGSIADVDYVDIFSKIKKNDRIKAVVLRVNSPGGSILASENIKRGIRLVRDSGKPVVVSMGDYAASGGYYISALADSIFAEPNTLTGSIGVYSMLPNPHALLEEKLGINFDTVGSGKFSTSFTPFFAWGSEEDRYLQERTDEFYEIFLDLVAQGREMTRDEVHQIAQGRIWSGKQAHEIGLVDGLGGLDKAISSAATLAELESYKTTEYPKLPNPFQRMIQELAGQDASIVENYFDTKLKRQFPELKELETLLTSREPMARLPFVIKVR